MARLRRLSLFTSCTTTLPGPSDTGRHSGDGSGCLGSGLDCRGNGRIVGDGRIEGQEAWAVQIKRTHYPVSDPIAGYRVGRYNQRFAPRTAVIHMSSFLLSASASGMLSFWRRASQRRLPTLGVLLALPVVAMAQVRADVVLSIPRLDRPPVFDEFLGMRPPPDLAEQMTMVSEFVQREPRDGAPSSSQAGPGSGGAI